MERDTSAGNLFMLLICSQIMCGKRQWRLSVAAAEGILSCGGLHMTACCFAWEIWQLTSPIEEKYLAEEEEEKQKTERNIF